MPSPALDPGQPAATEPDRRRYPRVGTQVQIEIHEEGTDVPMRLETTDLSAAAAVTSRCSSRPGSMATPQ